MCVCVCFLAFLALFLFSRFSLCVCVCACQRSALSTPQLGIATLPPLHTPLVPSLALYRRMVAPECCTSRAPHERPAAGMARQPSPKVDGVGRKGKRHTMLDKKHCILFGVSVPNGESSSSSEPCGPSSSSEEDYNGESSFSESNFD